jgi:energy-coupling factor transport system ATP-binding protein
MRHLPSAIDLQDVTWTYEGQCVPSLSRVNLRIDRGECILLCGKSGCGKTTVTRLLSGLIPGFFNGKYEGEVSIFGENIADQPMYRIAERVGAVFQNPRTQFYTTNTTSEIAFGCENMGLPPKEIKDRIEQTARELKIEKLLDKNIFHLSGGEKQIIAFASVFAMDPDVYVLDEPSSNLDPETIQKIQEILSLLKAQGKTIVIAEHRIYYLRGLADRAYYMEEGRIAGEYSMDELSAFDDEERMRTGIRSVNFPEYESREPRESHPLQQAPPFASVDMRAIKCRYEKAPVLDIPALRVSAGEVIAIIGKNGAGKSTFATALCGLLRKQKGSYSSSGKPLSRKRRIRKGYMVMQEVNHQLFADSVRGEITLGAPHSAGDENRLEHILEELDLIASAERHPMTLSGGQKQRVAIAAAMYCGKKVLVFDEPTSGLDYSHMMQMGKLLKRLKDDARFMFVITHDYEFVVKCCDRVIHIDGGGVSGSFRLDEAGYEKLKSVSDHGFREG